ncbi:nitroreductase family protein [Chitinasiproducens palmae]|uniref:nitroreductase family protein n=1 Tax=Chitinasiproducens palmae TaxID=1770053 RepID=UPI001F25B184
MVNNRHSCRAFLPEPPPAGTIERLVTLARAAPSGANLQPGEFILVAEAARERLCTALVDAWRSGAREAEDYTYFPEPMPLALRKRQVAAARALYDALGVARDDRKGRDAQFERNFRFFDAPLALLVTIDAKLGAGAYMDLGMTLHGLLLAAAAEGLGACAIGALALYPRLIRQTLGLDPARNIVCGVALGYADERAPVNRTRTARSTLDDFFTVLR